MKDYDIRERNCSTKRIYDFVLSFFGSLILAPVFLVIACLVRVGDGPGVFFKQRRVGLNGTIFEIWKFRTMIRGAEKSGLSITKSGDARITRLGRLLRKTKMDELPQLWNVLKGDMSFVGPRPEVPRYVELYSESQREVLNLKPGITDLATLVFRNEEELLKTAVDTEQFYLDYCLPRKIRLNLNYARKANLWEDTKIVLRTLLALRCHAPAGGNEEFSGSKYSVS